MIALRIALAGVVLMLHVASSWAASSVWAVKAGDDVFYLGGTVHVLRSADYPLPGEFATAYADADTLLFETDIGQLKEPRIQELMRDRLRYEDGRTLARVLSPRSYRMLEARARAVGLSFADLSSLRPVPALLRLVAAELQNSGVSGEGVDVHFYAKARNDRKRVASLETVESQVQVLMSLGEGQESELVMHAVEELERTQATFDETVAAWRIGDTGRLTELLLARTRQNYPALYRALIVRRNHEWLPELEKLFAEPGVEFVLVGVAHLVGEDGLLQALEHLGYEVRQLEEGGADWRG